MYGWLRGIIFSKLAFSVSRVAASSASSTVSDGAEPASPPAVVEHRALEPRAAGGSNCSSVRRRAARAAGPRRAWRPRVRSGQGQGLHAARAGHDQRAGPALTTAAAGSGRSTLHRGEARAVVAADEHVAGLADDDDAAALVERAGGQADAARRWQRSASCGRRRCCARTLPRRPCTTHGAVVADEAEQRALVGQLSARSGRCARSSLSSRPCSPAMKSSAPMRAHRVQVQALGVVDRVQQRLPGLAAVGGAQHQTEGADDVAVLRIVEPDVEERVLGALRGEAPAPRRATSVVAAARCSNSTSTSPRPRPSSWRVQVLPASALCSTTPSWPTAQPALAVGNCTATRSELTGTSACCQLLPASSLNSTVAALADGHHALAGACQAVEQAARGQRALAAPACRARRARPWQRRAPAAMRCERPASAGGQGLEQGAPQHDESRLVSRVQRTPAPASESAVHSRSTSGLVWRRPPVSAMKPVSE